jgi:tetratricopeptide (TPR) repeat protein
MRIHPSFSVRHITVGMVALAAALSSAVPARAADDGEPSSGIKRIGVRESYQDLVDEGTTLYKAREHRAAAEKFLQAYAIEQDPNLLFNVARCYDAIGDREAAIEKYEAYLAEPGIDPNGRERAERALRTLRKSKSHKTPPVRHTDESASKGEPGSFSAPSGNTKIIVGWVATAVLATGSVVTGVLAIDSANRLRDDKDAFPGNAADIDKLSTRTLTLSVTADALGVAAAVMGGLSLYWTLASPPSRSEIKAGIGPGGLRLVGSF